MSSEGTIIALLYILFLIALIVYLFVIHHQYQKRTGIFKPYVAPALANGFQPNGDTVIPLTPEQVAQNKATFQTSPSS